MRDYNIIQVNAFALKIVVSLELLMNYLNIGFNPKNC